MKKLKVGIVGAGNIAQNAHLPAYAKLKDRIEVAAIADINLDRAKEAAEKYGIPQVFSNVDELLAGCDVDYIDICTWNSAHAPVAIAAAKAKKDILCEKPMADSLENAIAMQKAVEENGVKFMMAVVTRYSTEAQTAHEMQKAGAFGDIYFARTAYTRRRGTPLGWFTDTALSGGGPVIDIGVHCIDRTWFLMGRPKPVSVSASTSYAIGNYQTKGVTRWCSLDKDTQVNFNTEDSAVALVRFENGAVMVAEISWAQNAPAESYVRLYGSKAGAAFDPLTVYGENEAGYLSDSTVTCGGDGEDIFYNEILYFADCLCGEKEILSPVEDGVSVQKILDGIYRSAAEGKEVTL